MAAVRNGRLLNGEKVSNPLITRVDHEERLCSVGADIYTKMMDKIHSGKLGEDEYRELTAHRMNCQECGKREN